MQAVLFKKSDRLIDRILNKTEIDDTESEDSKKEIKNTGTSLNSLNKITFLSHFIHPVESVNTAGDQRKDNNQSTTCRICITTEEIDFII